jgi:hypothetical protein
VKLSTAAIFGVGCLLGTRAGRQRYDQIRRLAGRLAEEFDGSGARQRLESISSRLEAYGPRGRHRVLRGWAGCPDAGVTAIAR